MSVPTPSPPDSSPFSSSRPTGGSTLGGLAASLGGLSPFQGPPTSSSAGGDRSGLASAHEGGATDGGLIRRVRGAQLPSANPVAARRARAAEAAPAQSADVVYSFLSDFTAGVRRGLDDSRSGRAPQP
jgi:hypothetical protein